MQFWNAPDSRSVFFFHRFLSRPFFFFFPFWATMIVRINIVLSYPIYPKGGLKPSPWRNLDAAGRRSVWTPFYTHAQHENGRWRLLWVTINSWTDWLTSRAKLCFCCYGFHRHLMFDRHRLGMTILALGYHLMARPVDSWLVTSFLSVCESWYFF